MSHAYKILPAENLVLNTIVGAFSYEEYRTLMENIMNDERFKPSMNMFWDLREVDASGFSSDDIDRIRAYMEIIQKKRGENYRVALLVSRALDYGISRMYQIVSDDMPFNLEIFYDEQEALNWIKAK